MVNESEVREYVETTADEEVIHLEMAASELVGPARHEIWDVHTGSNRWWVVTNPANLYDQADFKSRDVVLTFHVGLVLRTEYLNDREIDVRPEVEGWLPATWRLWRQAFDSYDSGDEVEDFQAVGVRLRECLIALVREISEKNELIESKVEVQEANFKGRMDLIANGLARGSSASRLRSYLKKTGSETWDLVNWLTHSKSSVRLDAEICLKSVEHLIGVVSASQMRAQVQPQQCENCASRTVVGGRCSECGWDDPDYVHPPEREPPPAEEVARRLAEPCTPSSDISTFIRPS
jgi:hypothetical protein